MRPQKIRIHASIMQISSSTGGALATLQGDDKFAKTLKSFKQLGTALESGSLSDAKKALTELQENTPRQASNASSPVSQKIEALAKAIDSGDVKAAQETFAAIKQKITFAGSANGSSTESGPSSSDPKPDGGTGNASANKSYDKMDANKDGKVSWKEKQDYTQKHPETEKSKTTTVKIDSDRGLIDALA